MKVFLIPVFIILSTLTACATNSQDVYTFDEAGKSSIIDFGTVIDVRPIQIKGPNSGLGAVAGAGTGALVGSQIGDGDGRGAAMIVGAVAGLAGGYVAEQALQDKDGREFTISLENGKTITVPQYFKKEERIIQKGDRVMVQTSGSYQRVLPAGHLPKKK